MSPPEELQGIVPGETAATWVSVRDVVPASAYLGGGTAIAVHLRHRISRDLDFFLRRPVDLDELVAALQERGSLSYLDDVEEDPAVPLPVPLPKDEVAAYWRARVPEIARSLSRLG